MINPKDARNVVQGPNRRLLMMGALSVTAAPSLIWAAVREAGPRPATRLMVALCDLTIPATDTPGALETNVPAFVELAIAHGLRGATSNTLLLLRQVLDDTSQASFVDLPRDRQLPVLVKVDASTLGKKPASPWALVKSLILRGYYTSEVGASRELRYDLDPGRYDPDLPLGPNDRAWSTDALARQAESA